MEKTQEDTKVFIAYSRKDTYHLEELQIYLRPLERRKTIKIWYDGEIVPGQTWDAQIKQNLGKADIVLLLLSAYSLASDYFWEEEMEVSLQRHHNGRCIVIPVILSYCSWKQTDLEKIQALPSNGLPVNNWVDKAEVYTNIVDGIYESIKLLKNGHLEKRSISTLEPKKEALLNEESSQMLPVNLPTVIKELLRDMVSVEGGSFLMGCTPEQGEGRGYEKPSHKVILDSYKIGKYPITQAQWRAVMGSDPEELRFKGCDRCPVESVSWEDVQTFLKNLNQLTERNFRLPTEAEWEYAGRGGRKCKSYKYAGSNDLVEVGWYEGNSENKIHPVGEKKANELGLYDMSGNVWEWCNDWYAREYYKDSPSKKPQGPKNGIYRLLRGGSWGSNTNYARVANRSYNDPTNRSSNFGFRLAE